MIRAALALSLLASPAFAQESAQIGMTSAIYGATVVTLRATDAPGAVAEVHIHDAYVNNPGDDGDYTLTWNGLLVVVSFTYSGAGADMFVVTPPAGYMAVPPHALVPEHESEVILIYVEGLS
jgi:hypothetical protein